MWRTIKIKAERQSLSGQRRPQSGFRGGAPPPPSPALSRTYPTSSPPPRPVAAMTDSGLGIAPAPGTTSAIGQVENSHTLSTHHINKHILSILPSSYQLHQLTLSTSYQYNLSTHLSTHPLNTPTHPCLSTHPISILLGGYVCQQRSGRC